MNLVTPRLYRAATRLGAPAIAAYLAWRRARGKEDAARYAERRGIAAQPRPAGNLVWLHAASVGEAQSALALIERLLARDRQLNLLITTGTVTSARLMAERLPPRAIHQYAPVDRLPWVQHFLDHWHPDVALWIESELWPNLVLETARRGIPMVLVNARMSDRSLAGWRRLPGMIGPLLASFRRVLAQSETDAARYRALGASAVVATGSLKYDAEPLPADPVALSELSTAIKSRPRWLAASTHPGEEAIIAEAHRRLKSAHPRLLTIIAPRHAARGGEIAAMMRSEGILVAQRATAEPVMPATEAYLADTMGELGLFYRLVNIVFVGGSLVPHGGQNLLEPARLGCALLHGPHVQNFRAIADDLAAARATAEVRDAASLAHAVDLLLRDDAQRARRAAAAQRVAEAGRGVLDAILAALAPELSALATPMEASVARA